MLPIYCISLQRERKKRYVKAYKKYFKPYNLNVIEWKAIDGNNYKNSLDLATKNNFKLTKRLGRELNKSVVATAASHRSIWQEIVNKNLEAAIILEDDVTIKSDFENKLSMVWNLIKNDKNINVLLLSFSNNIIVETKERHYNDLINKLDNFNGLFCYLVKFEGAKILLNNSYNLSYQIDIHISKKLNIHYSCKKKLGYYNESVISTIHLYRFKILEYYFKMNFLHYRVTKPLEFYTPTIFTLILIFLGILLNLCNYLFWKISLVNLIILISEIKIVGGRFDEFNFRFPGLIKDIGSYDSDEIANKIVDHLFLLLGYGLTNLGSIFLSYLF